MNLMLAALLVAASGPADATPEPSTPAAAAPPAEGSAPALAPPVASAPAAGDPQPREVYKLHLAVDVPVTLVAASAGLVRELFKDQLARKSCPCDPSGINALDRDAVHYHNATAGLVSDITAYGVPFVVPVIDLLDLGAGRAWGADLVVYAETIAIDTALQNATNFIVARPRPRTYANDPAFVAGGEGYLSFYAGHVSTIFAVASSTAFTIRERYGEQVWPWLVGGAVGASVAVERVASGNHFPTDVAVAAVVGTAVGITVPWLHLRRGRTGVQLVPSAQGLGLAGTF